jgi:hypothetical protein
MRRTLFGFVVCLGLATAMTGEWAMTGGAALAAGLQEKQETTNSQDDKQDDAKEETVEVVLAEGRLDFQAPKSWEKKQPKFNIVEVEFAPKSSKENVDPARLTIMASGGSVEANLERWLGQFSQEDASDTEDHTKQEVKKINGMQVHIVDIHGTYADSAGPFAGNAVQRKGYRMLGAIVETKIVGNYYFKMYGPKETMDEHEKRFLKMIETIKLSL